MDGKVTIIINDYEYVISGEKLKTIPESRLSQLYDKDNDQEKLSFSRCSESFKAIYECYQTGRLHVPKSVCIGKFKEELKFWKIETNLISDCCERILYEHESELRQMKKAYSYFKCRKVTENKEETKIRNLRRRIWDVVDHRSTGTASKVYFSLSTLVVLLSIILIILSTLPTVRNIMVLGNVTDPGQTVHKTPLVNHCLQCSQLKITEQKYVDTMNDLKYICSTLCQQPLPQTIYIDVNVTIQFSVHNNIQKFLQSEICTKCKKAEPNHNVPKEEPQKLANIYTYVENKHLHFFIFEIFGAICFTVELCVRLICCPSIKNYLLDILNIFDILSLLASHARYIIYIFTINLNQKEFDFLLYLQMFRALRLLRSFENVMAFRVLRFSVGSGRDDLLLIASYVFMGLLLFSNFIYFVEPDDTFSSMFDAMWWSIVTMTTVGYGDVYPKSVFGKFIGAACALYGVVMFSLTIPIFSNTFHSVYKTALFSQMNINKKTSDITSHKEV